MITSFKRKLQPYFSSVKIILIAALFVRIVAAIFSQGYGMHDDHFLVIEASASWVDHGDYSFWLPGDPGNKGYPEGHSFTYVGLHYFFFLIMKVLGVADPKILMLIVRLLHAFLSMLVVFYGIKITERLADRKSAITVGWFLALLWILPFLSVRNLVELTAIPFLMIGTWYLLKPNKIKYIFLAGVFIGIAISFRYQIGIFAVGIAMYAFFKFNWKMFFYFSFGVLVMFILSQGLVDYLIWGCPFAEFLAYVQYNMKDGTEYLPNSNYFMYFLVLIGSMFVPMGILLFIGVIKGAKKYALLFVPFILFLLFHTIYPNRQERFILSVLPFFIILGVIGYQELLKFKAARSWWNISVIIFWLLNIPLLSFATFHYSKKSRVESSYTLYDNGMERERILQEATVNSNAPMIPKFYGKAWFSAVTPRLNASDDLKMNVLYDFDYIFFYTDENMAARVAQYEKIYPKMELVKKCYPSFVDDLLTRINPKNNNEYIEVWKTNAAN